MIFYIYLIENLINHKKYIGQRSYKGINIEKDTYMGSSKELKYDINTLGLNNFNKKILEICSSKEELNNKEKYYINLYNAVSSKDFYNIAEGGTGGNTWDGLSEKRKKEIKKEFSNRYSGEGNPRYGYRYSQEEKEKLSKAIKDSYIQHKERWGTTGYKGEKNSLSMIIYSPELNQTFYGIREASRQLNIPSPNIIRALKSNGKFSAGKYNGQKIHWFYGENKNET